MYHLLISDFLTMSYKSLKLFTFFWNTVPCMILGSKILQTETSSNCNTFKSPFAVVFDDFLTLFWIPIDQLISSPLCIPSRCSNAYSKVYLKVSIPSSEIPDKLQKRLMFLWNQEFLCEIPNRKWYIREIGGFLTIPLAYYLGFQRSFA